MPVQDVVIPIAYPDYLIAVETPGREFTIPDYLPYIDIFPDKVHIRPAKRKVAELGHAGVLFFDGKTGLTKYYEYGRYDAANLGLTRRVPIPDVKIGSSGRPTRASLLGVLKRISDRAGQKGRIEGAYIELPDGSFEKMLSYATNRVKENRQTTRAPYSLTGNSCMHFAKSVAEQGGADVPWILDPRPNSFIEEVQSAYPPLSYTPPDKLSLDGSRLDD